MVVTQHRYAVEGWGVGEVRVVGRVVAGHALPSPAGHATSSPPAGGPRGGASAPGVTLPLDPARMGDGLVPDLCRRLARHLAGEPTAYDDVELELTAATPFERALVEAARGIAWGQVVSYGELAALAGRPRAARAAGTFCARNRFSLIVPCHRVVAAGTAGYGLGGYGPGGEGLKRRLLALEDVLL